jgi:hypothetical protein
MAIDELEIDTWRHATTGKLHISEECQAVRWYRSTMTEGVILASDYAMAIEAMKAEPNICKWCVTRWILRNMRD